MVRVLHSNVTVLHIMLPILIFKCISKCTLKNGYDGKFYVTCILAQIFF